MNCLGATLRTALVAATAAALAVLGTSAVRAAPSGAPNFSKFDRYEPRFGRTKPVIAVIGENAGTELIDFTVPYGVLAASGAAEVRAVATGAGSLRMLPALSYLPQDTLDSFDADHPQGADYVIVPAVQPADEFGTRRLVSWLQAQAAKGATVISICDGALVVAKAGLFAGHAATGHWATQKAREHDYPETRWLTNIRYVADGKVASSAGVTAAMPLSLALVEAIAGHDRAAEVAATMGVSEWGNAHDSSKFRIGAGGYLLAARNWVSRHQQVELQVDNGINEVALALSADAFSRTFRSKAVATATAEGPIISQHGLTVLPDRIDAHARTWKPVDLAANVPAAASLDIALDAIGQKFGPSTANFVALQLEYPR